MKLNKFTKTAVVFTLGASVFVTTAFADMLLGSGYDKLKDSIKSTVSSMTNEYSSYTEINNMDVYLDEEIMYSVSNKLLVDNINKREQSFRENTDFTTANSNSIYESYEDTLYRLYKNNSESEYTGYKFTSENVEFVPGNNYNDFFTDEYAAEFEKIFDAAVGNLKNLVQYDTQADDHKLYTGTLNASQVPALYNALISLVLKDGMGFDYEDTKGINEIKDAYVAEITGEAVENNNGHLTKIAGKLVLKFNDQNSNQHSLTVNIGGELKDINNTNVNKPAFDETKLSEIANDYNAFNIIPEKYVGTYTTPIIIETDDSFIKIGDRTVVITNITETKISGKYEEVFVDNEYTVGLTPVSFEFNEVKDNQYISYTDPVDGETKYASIGAGLSGIYFEYGIKLKNGSYSYEDVYNNYGNENAYYESYFVRVYE